MKWAPLRQITTTMARETRKGYIFVKLRQGSLFAPPTPRASSPCAALLRCLLTLTEPVGLASPKFPNIDVSRTQVRREGSSFPLLCEAQGHPTPAFR